MSSGASAVEDAVAVPRFAQAYQICPMCESPEVEYEFVVDRVALSHCSACTLLFANPPPQRTDAQPASPDAQAAYEALRRFATAYLGRDVSSVLMVDRGGAPLQPGADVLRGDVLGGARRYDLVVAFGVVERDPDALQLLDSLRDVIAPDGALLFVTPSLVSAAARAMRDTWPALRSKATWWFTPDTAQLLLTRAGYGDFITIIEARDVDAAAGPALRRFFDSNVALFARPVQRSERRLLSVIVPVFNEAPTVAELLDAVTAKNIAGVEIEIVIVESNSTDGSRDIVQRYADHPRVRIVLEDRPRGKGSAVRTGLEHAAGEVVLFQDADLEYDVSDYERLVEPLFKLRRTFVLGSRHGATGQGWKIRRFEQRRLFSSAMNLAHLGLLSLFNRLYRQKLFDPFTMYKVFRRDCLYGLTFACNRFDFDIEIAAKLIRKGYHPLEIPVNYRSRSFSEGKKVAVFADPPTWVKAMLRVRRAPLYDRFPASPA
jgi:hypothetical protein